MMILLLLLLRGLGSLLLQLVNRLLRVGLVPTVGLDLHHRNSVSKVSPPLLVALRDSQWQQHQT